MNLKEWLVGSFAQIGQILSILYGSFTTFASSVGHIVGALRASPLEPVWCVWFAPKRSTDRVEGSPRGRLAQLEVQQIVAL